ncbi:hypothetical protein QR680_000485 [Steinernema hermaphroditum]|uniref:WAP domain-containing protein n=1 Tax=Steinernema hermaphroditum TaxID=289476 RepID=A0AA39LE67_9BILA|nr:hypothetical protein QR680_000485 [Steinernema hermaphroditum]
MKLFFLVLLASLAYGRWDDFVDDELCANGRHAMIRAMEATCFVNNECPWPCYAADPYTSPSRRLRKTIKRVCCEEELCSKKTYESHACCGDDQCWEKCYGHFYALKKTSNISASNIVDDGIV